jgi:hypothetical protein
VNSYENQPKLCESERKNRQEEKGRRRIGKKKKKKEEEEEEELAQTDIETRMHRHAGQKGHTMHQPIQLNAHRGTR